MRCSAVQCSATEYNVVGAGDPLGREGRRSRFHDNAVSPGQVEQVVNTRPRLVLTGREGTEYVFGTTDTGRHLLVVLTEAIDGRDYVVTAREMTEAERRAFRREGR